MRSALVIGYRSYENPLIAEVSRSGQVHSSFLRLDAPKRSPTAMVAFDYTRSIRNPSSYLTKCARWPRQIRVIADDLPGKHRPIGNQVVYTQVDHPFAVGPRVHSPPVHLL